MSQQSQRPSTTQPRFRTRFQLAPLVDLLLIIVFAQFLEVRTTVRNETLALEERIAAADQRSERLLDDQANLQKQREAEREQAARALRTIASLFGMPNEQVQDYASGSDSELVNDLNRVAEKAAALSTESPASIIRFLIGHQELLKRADVWNLHVGGDRKTTVMVGGETVQFSLERSGQDARAKEFEDALFTAYKQLPQPKELVVILASYSPDSVAGVYQSMIDGIPGALERMRADDPTTRFEYTVLGATESPEPVTSKTTENLP